MSESPLRRDVGGLAADSTKFVTIDGGVLLGIAGLVRTMECFAVIGTSSRRVVCKAMACGWGRRQDSR